MRSFFHPFVIIFILLLATFFRFHALTEIPPGLTHDEADVGFFVRQVANQTGFVIDAPYGYANEPFTKFSASVVMWLVGQSDWALRAHQALWGILLVVFTYRLGGSMFNRNVGLAGAGLVAVSYWATATSRFALNSNPTAALFTGAVWLMWMALFRERLRYRWAAWLGFAGLLAGSLLTYEAARGAWLSLPAFLLYIISPAATARVALTSPRATAKPQGTLTGSSFISPISHISLSSPRNRLTQFTLALALGTALALPHLLNPAAWGRSGNLSGALNEAALGNLGPLWNNTVETGRAFFLTGDPFPIYNLPGRPTFDPTLAILFLGGLALCLRRWRTPAGAYSLLWLGAGFAPAAAVGPDWLTLHAITLQGLACILSASFVDWLANRLHRYRRYVWGAFVILAGLTAAFTYRDYFRVWGQATEIRAAYLANFSAVMDYVRRTPHTGSVTLSSPFPNPPHDPFSYDLRVRRADIDARWFNAREAFVFPQTETSLLILPSTTPPDPSFAARLPAAERHIVRLTDVDPYFDTLLWNPQQTLNNWLATAPLTQPNPPLNFGGAVELFAYQLMPSGDCPPCRPVTVTSPELTVLTFWRILDPAALGPRHPTGYAPEARLFVHALDAQGNYVTGNDRLGAPAWNWHTGDVFAQLHRLELQPGAYELRAGIYLLPDVIRLTGPDYDSASLGSVVVETP